MMLWTSNISGSPASSTAASARIGMRRSPNASNCSCESQISLTRKLPSEPNATWNSSPSGGHSPEDSTRGRVSSYFFLVIVGAPVKRTTMLIVGSSMFGDGRPYLSHPLGSRRSTYDELHGQDGRQCRGVRILDQLDRPRRGERAQLAAILADRRQRRVRERGRLEVVEADDGHVASRLEPDLPDRLQRRERHQVRGGDDRRRPLLQRQQRARL